MRSVGFGRSVAIRNYSQEGRVEKDVGVDGGRVERRTIAWRRVSGRRVPTE